MAEQAIINTSTLTEIADAIREKTGKADTFLPSDMPAEILAIETGSDVSGVTAAASDVRSGKKFMNSSGALLDGTLVTRSASDLSASEKTVSVPAGIYDSTVSKSVTTATQATPTISVNSSGLITASCTQSSGYVSGSTKSARLQLSSSQDADFIASNIKNGVNIFGITGSYKGDISSYTFTNNDIFRVNSNTLCVELPSGFKNKTINGYIHLHETGTDQNVIIMFKDFNFNSLTSSSQTIWINIGTMTWYFDEVVSEAEGVTGIFIDVYGRLTITGISNVFGVIYYK